MNGPGIRKWVCVFLRWDRSGWRGKQSEFSLTSPPHEPMQHSPFHTATKNKIILSLMRRNMTGVMCSVTSQKLRDSCFHCTVIFEIIFLFWFRAFSMNDAYKVEQLRGAKTGIKYQTGFQRSLKENNLGQVHRWWRLITAQQTNYSVEEYFAQPIASLLLRIRKKLQCMQKHPVSEEGKMRIETHLDIPLPLHLAIANVGDGLWAALAVVMDGSWDDVQAHTHTPDV